MKLKSAEIENFRAIDSLHLRFDSSLTVLHGDNGAGKTSVLSAIAVGLGAIPTLLPDVAGTAFLGNDRRHGKDYTRVALVGTNEVSWERTSGRIRKQHWLTAKEMLHPPARNPLRELKHWLEKEGLAGWGKSVDLPIMTYYDTERAVGHRAQRRPRTKRSTSRFTALAGALSARTSFKELFEWFYQKENEELREQRERRNLEYRLRDLSAVRTAISSMINNVSDPHVKLNPLRFVVTETLHGGATQERTLDQLSGGQQAVLALAADLAWRMAHGNPHRANPLESEAVVLIDEVELHLHPSWQQRILTDLRRTFPGAQFIVSTHSPQVLTTVSPKRIVSLNVEKGQIVAAPSSAATYGAEAGDVLASEMGVDERPQENAFVKTLNHYMQLVSNDDGESENALALRSELEAISPLDHALERADLEIKRRKVLKDMTRDR